MPPRRAVILVLTLLALLHTYIGLRLIPPLNLSTGGVAVGVLLLAISTLLLPTGLIGSRMKQARWGERLTWLGLLAMGFFPRCSC
ncbi:MAG: hypothetical protein ACLGI6_14880 [Gammaproteobacteria bacterium]